MNKRELKKILKPLIHECIKEVIFEEGTLSTIIAEVVKGTGSREVVQESRPPRRLESEQESSNRRRQNLHEQRKKMLEAVGKSAYNGVNLFEGTTPLTNRGSSTSPQGSLPLDGTDPSDPGVDISKFGLTGVWKKLAGK